MQYLPLLGGIIGVAANVPLFLGIMSNKIYQNFTAWMLWAFLDIIATTNIFIKDYSLNESVLKDGNFWLPLFYTIGSVAISSLLAYKKLIKWTPFEVVVTVLVVVCIVIWHYVGNKEAIIASVTAICIASFPLIRDTIKDPSITPTKIYIFYCIANLLGLTAGGNNWTVENKLYPLGVLSFSALLVLLSLRKKKVIVGVH